MISEQHATLQDQELYRDTRPASLRVLQFLQSRHAIYWYLGLFGLSMAVPGGGPLALFLVLVSMMIFLSRTYTLPIQIPATSRLRSDPHDLKPDTETPGKPNGIYFWGNEKKTNLELWSTKPTQTEHLAYLATTGGGKTIGLTSQLVNAFIQGSGACYTDGKAQTDVAVRIMSLAHRFGRLHDLFALNFMTGGKSPWEIGEIKRSHSFSFLYSGSSSMVSETLLGMLNVDNDMWGERARLYLRAISFLVTYKRDTGQIQPDVDYLIKLLDLQNALQEMSDRNTPEAAKGLLEAYLRNLPGMTEMEVQTIMSTGQVNEEIAKQHGFITMQLVPMLSTMQYEFGEVVSPKIPEIDLYDVVVHNRILVVLLPALEKSPETVASLGRLVVSAVKAMMARAIYTELEGDVSENLDRLPTNADTPFPIIWDEVGYYMVEAHAVKAAQARSLNFTEMYGAQDKSAMGRLGDKEKSATESVLANTNTKLIGRTEDANETLRMIKERAGEDVFSEQTSLGRHNDGMFGAYINQGVSMVRRARLTIQKLANQGSGDVFVLWKNNIIHARMFYAQVDQIRKMTLNRFVALPDLEQYTQEFQIDANLIRALKEAARPSVKFPSPNDSQELSELLKSLSDGKMLTTHIYLEKVHKEREQEIAELLNFGPSAALGDEDDYQEDGGLFDHIPSPMAPLETSRQPKPELNDPIAGQYEPLFNLLFQNLGEGEEELAQSLLELEQMQASSAPGTAEQRAEADRLVLDTATVYPREPVPTKDPEGLATLANELAELFDESHDT